MIIYVDIDETICYYEGERDYNTSKTILQSRIEKINSSVRSEGNTIVYWTARGTLLHKINWFHVTFGTIKSLGNCKFHELRMGKPAYDLIY